MAGRGVDVPDLDSTVTTSGEKLAGQVYNHRCYLRLSVRVRDLRVYVI